MDGTAKEHVPLVTLTEEHFAGTRGIRELYNAMHTLYDSLSLVKANPAVKKLRMVKLEQMEK